MNWLPEVLSQLEGYGLLVPWVRRLSEICDLSAPDAPEPQVERDEECETISVGWRAGIKELNLLCEKYGEPSLEMVHGNRSRIVLHIDPIQLTRAVQSYWQAT